MIDCWVKRIRLLLPYQYFIVVAADDYVMMITMMMMMMMMMVHFNTNNKQEAMHRASHKGKNIVSRCAMRLVKGSRAADKYQ
jgi:hypothetical protein